MALNFFHGTLRECREWLLGIFCESNERIGLGLCLQIKVIRIIYLTGLASHHGHRAAFFDTLVELEKLLGGVEEVFHGGFRDAVVSHEYEPDLGESVVDCSPDI